jgi:hypothetical protein
MKRHEATLASPDDGPDELFSPDMVADLPAPARRYLLHAIRPGTPLARSATLWMSGEIRLGRRQPWLAMKAWQLLAPPEGFVWEARIGRFGLSFAGSDSYVRGEGLTAFRLWERIPIVRASGPDVSRSARGRLAIESIWSPASLLPQRGVIWTAIDERTVQAALTIDGDVIPLTLTIGTRGNVQDVKIARWGNLTVDGHYTPIPFGADVFGERTFGGYTVPSHLSASWWHDTDREFRFFTAHIVDVTFSV